jgi:hypothetical protein
MSLNFPELQFEVTQIFNTKLKLHEYLRWFTVASCECQVMAERAVFTCKETHKMYRNSKLHISFVTSVKVKYVCNNL